MVKTYRLTCAKDGTNISVLFFFNTTSDQTGPADFSIIVLRLLPGSLVRYYKDESREATMYLEQSSSACPSVRC